MKNINQKIKETEDKLLQLKELKVKLDTKQNTQKWLKIPECGIEMETKVHDKNKILAYIQIPKGMRLLTIPEITKVFENEKYKNVLVEANNGNFWIFVKNYSWINNYVAWFYALSDRALLPCSRDPQSSDSGLGVIFCRDLKKSFLAKKPRKETKVRK